MTDESKTVEKVEAQQEVPRGSRGEKVGVATAADKIKALWHEEHHVLMNVGNHRNPRKQAWMRKQGSPRLKEFARDLKKQGNEVAVEWFANKNGAKNQVRSDANRTRISLEKVATKAAKKGKGGGK